jgi:hypothetical protein
MSIKVGNGVDELIVIGANGCKGAGVCDVWGLYQVRVEEDIERLCIVEIGG